MSIARFFRQLALIMGLVLTFIGLGQASTPIPTLGLSPAPLALVGPLARGDAPPVEGSIGAAPLPGAPAYPLMQFRSGGHVLGFSPEGLLVAGRDHLLKVNFLDAAKVAPEVPETAASPEPTGSEPTGAQGAAALTAVTYKNLWPDIDLTYDGNDGIVRSTYTLAPGADPARIRLVYNVPFEVTDDGALTLRFATGTLTETAPIAWQEIDGQHIPVTVAFLAHTDRELGFTLGDYDPARPLTIDPTLVWNTFLGGTGTDYGYGIATDSVGNVYVTGISDATSGSDATWSAPVRAHSGDFDAFVARLAANGNLIWNTFLGGTGRDYGYGIATDSAGNVYVTGVSAAIWGSPVRGYSSDDAFLDDAFVARLDASGALVWNTFLGGVGNDGGVGIATDSVGNVYVTGYSFIFTWGAPVRAHSGGGNDAFVARLAATSGALVGNTFLGGVGADIGFGIATDAADNVYVTGYSGLTWGSPVRAHSGGGHDAFVARLAFSGNLIWNTFLGGAGTDYGYGIATDSVGNVYVTGYSEATWGSPVRGDSGGGDAFVARLDASGNLAWNTFLGGVGTDYGQGIATDSAGNVYVTGYSDATWGAPVRPYIAGGDAFASRLASGGALVGNTFLGSAGFDYGYGIATDSAGNVYVTGGSTANWGSPVRPYSAGVDAFVARLGVAADPAAAVTLTVNGNGDDSVSATNPVTVTYKVVGCQGNEMFLVVNAPAMGIPWSYLNAAGQWVPLPANLADILPFSSSGPADGAHTLFTGNVPPGDYELYLGCDFVKDGRLNIDPKLQVDGVYGHALVTVQ